MKTDYNTERGSNSKTRLSVSIPKEEYKELQELSRRMRVSLAWIVRDAIRQYIKTDAKKIRDGW